MKQVLSIHHRLTSLLHNYWLNHRLELVVFVYLLGLIFLTSRFMLQSELFRVHDYVHGARIAEMLRSAQAGHLPVRWTENFGYGYGMPLFQFYAPLPFYVGAFSYWLTNNLILSTKLLFLLPNVAAVIGSYLLGKELFGKKGGVVVAAAYSLAPYRAVNLFVRGAVSEAWGMSIMPLALWAGLVTLRKARTQKNESLYAQTAQNSHWWILVASLVVLFLSHNLSTLMFTPMSAMILFLVALSFVRFKPVTLFYMLLPAALGYVLAVGLSSFYLIPAFVEKDATIIGTILSGYFHYSHHFLYIRQFFFENWGYGGSAWGPDDDISFFLGYGQLAAAGLSTLAVGNYLFRTSRQHSLSVKESITHAISKARKAHHFHYFIIFSTFLLLSLYLTLLKSKWLWDVVPLISFIQFPWRWLSIAVLMISLLAGYGIILLKDKRAIFSTAFILISLSLLNAQYFQPESYLEDSSSFYYADESLIRRQMSGILPDYIPKDLAVSENIQPADADSADTEVDVEAVLPVNQDGLVLFDDSIDATVLVNQPHQKLVAIDDFTDNELTFAVAAYPGWEAEINGEPVELNQTKQGLLSIKNIPQEVSEQPFTAGIYFGSTPVRFWSDIVSLVSLAGVLFLVLPTPRKNEPSKTIKIKS